MKSQKSPNQYILLCSLICTRNKVDVELLIIVQNNDSIIIKHVAGVSALPSILYITNRYNKPPKQDFNHYLSWKVMKKNMRT